MEVKTSISLTLSTSMPVSAVYSRTASHDPFWSLPFMGRLCSRVGSSRTAASFQYKSSADDIGTESPAHEPMLSKYLLGNFHLDVDQDK